MEVTEVGFTVGELEVADQFRLEPMSFQTTVFLPLTEEDACAVYPSGYRTLDLREAQNQGLVEETVVQTHFPAQEYEGYVLTQLFFHFLEEATVLHFSLSDVSLPYPLRGTVIPFDPAEPPETIRQWINNPQFWYPNFHASDPTIIDLPYPSVDSTIARPRAVLGEGQEEYDVTEVSFSVDSIDVPNNFALAGVELQADVFVRVPQ